MNQHDFRSDARKRYLSFISEGIEEDDDGAVESSFRSALPPVDEARDRFSNSQGGSLGVSKGSLTSSYRQNDSPGASIRSSLRSSTKSSRSSNYRSYYDNITSSIHRDSSSNDTSTREVDVSNLSYIVELDEMDPLPENYKDFSPYGDCFIYNNNNMEKNVDAMYQAEEEDGYHILPSHFEGYDVKSRSYHYAMLTVGLALSLALMGIYLASKVLASVDPAQYTLKDGTEAFLYLPRFTFGGINGGLEGANEMQHIADSTYYAQYDSMKDSAFSSAGSASWTQRHSNNIEHVTSSVTKSQDPFGGFGPPQFNPAYNMRSASIGGVSHEKPTFTSTPLTSYTPPESEFDHTFVLDPLFHGAMMDISVLPYNPIREIPVFWDVPFSGSTKIKHILGHCLKLVQCSAVGRNVSPTEPKEGRNLSGGGETNLHGDINIIPLTHSSTYSNVQCAATDGIRRAISRNLATANLGDAIHTPDIMDAARIFEPPVEFYGRGVVLIRNPLDRVVAMHEYLKRAKHDSRHGMVADMSPENFFKSDMVEDNLLTRTLSGNKVTSLTDEDLELAKQILKRKFIVGLYEHMQGSINRFESFFKWHPDESAQSCQSSQIQRERTAYYNKYSFDATGSNDGTGKPHPDLDDASLQVLFSKNKVDLILYDYAKFLFDYQGRVLFGVGSHLLS